MLSINSPITSITKCSIQEHNVNRINSIKDKYKDLRQLSKPITFACTYGGTPHTLVKNCGLSQEQAQQAYDRYHEMYKVSDNWVNSQIKKATHTGYVTVAFGLRVRTPRLTQVILNTIKTPKEAEAEKRTAANSCGQSWCLLNSRAGIEFNQRVRNSIYKYDIKPIGQIHDSQYFLIKDDLSLVLWANKYLVKAVSWQEDPAIKHDIVHLGGEMSIFFPDWAHELVIPNNCSKQHLLTLVKDYKKQL